MITSDSVPAAAGQGRLTVVAVAGPSQCGKTTLICRLLPLLQARGYRVGVIKHSHKRFDPDPPGKDTWRFRQAGAAVVGLTAPGLVQLTWADGAELPLAQILALAAPGLDLLLVEGYKQSRLPKLVFWTATEESVPNPAPPVLAYLTPGPITLPTPVFQRDQVEEIADFLSRWLQQRLPASF